MRKFVRMAEYEWKLTLDDGGYSQGALVMRHVSQLLSAVNGLVHCW